ncbi:MAG: hypothetical protein HY775_03755 [Acidobacteria bacterium]|nr:hypothetical protein [Acidobacteriota bacterium]
MLVRCGRCRAELEVSGPGEFACPSCGTRNAVRGAGPRDVGGLTVPGGMPPPAPRPDPSIRWASCPACSWRFAIGEVPEVTCPSCRAHLEVTAAGLRAAGS